MSIATKLEGWVIVNEDHPNVDYHFISSHTFERTRSEAIKKFTWRSKKPWGWWKRKYKYKAVRAEMTITVKDGS